MRSPFAMAWAMAAVMGMGAAAVGQERGDGGAGKGAGAAEGGEKRAEFIAGKPELARVYLELERLLMERAGTMPVETLRRVNVGVDNAANGFFTGNYSRAIKGMNAQIGAIEAGCGAWASSMAVRVERRVVRPGERVAARVGCMYATGAPAFEALILPARLEASDINDSRVLAQVRMWDARESEDVEFAFPEGGDAWLIRTKIRMGDGPPQECSKDVARIFRTPESLDDVRERLTKRLDAIDHRAGTLTQSIAGCRFRTESLSDQLSPEITYLFSANPVWLAGRVEKEVAALERREDPYDHDSGNLWIGLRVGESMVPVRMFVPLSLERGHAAPLIIAVHGAGGDENLWMDGYGGGALKDVAREKGAIVVSPRIVPGLFTPAMFDGIVEAVAKWQDVDRSRVYVIGHSMGGGVVTAWAKLRSDKIAAACSIAGVGSFTAAKKMAPMLAYAAELDGLIRPEGIRKSAEAGKAAGLDVEFREVANYGHVLVVGKVTREAVEWMMERKLKGEAESGKAEGKGEK